jgi:hypothetical protein
MPAGPTTRRAAGTSEDGCYEQTLRILQSSRNQRDANQLLHSTQQHNMICPPGCMYMFRMSCLPPYVQLLPGTQIIPCLAHTHAHTPGAAPATSQVEMRPVPMFDIYQESTDPCHLVPLLQHKASTSLQQHLICQRYCCTPTTGAENQPLNTSA